MGKGGFSLALKACFVNVTGSEYADHLLNWGQQNGIQTLSANTNLPSEKFHLINTEQVMEHVISPAETLEKLVKALTPGGLIKISVPFSSSLEAEDTKIGSVSNMFLIKRVR